MVRKFAALATVLTAALPAAAQKQSISVYFEPTRDQLLNNAIAAALTQPPFVLQTRRMAGALEVTIPDRIQVEYGQVTGTSWTFTVAFRRDGDSLGQSVESCNEHKLTDCTDQLVSDVKSAAGMGN